MIAHLPSGTALVPKMFRVARRSAFSLAVATIMLAHSAQACSARPKQLSLEEIRAASDVAVRGELTYAYAPQPGLDNGPSDWLVGAIVAHEKGDNVAAAYPIRHAWLEFNCQGWGWEPGPDTVWRRYSGEFFLQRRRDRYVILGYRP